MLKFYIKGFSTSLFFYLIDKGEIRRAILSGNRSCSNINVFVHSTNHFFFFFFLRKYRFILTKLRMDSFLICPLKYVVGTLNSLPETSNECPQLGIVENKETICLDTYLEL